MLKARILVLITILFILHIPGATADWAQWRGPLCNGIVTDTPPLADAWPAEGPRKIWQVGGIPGDGNRSGGWGSPTIAEGRVFLFVNWYAKVNWESIVIEDQLLYKMGWWGKRMPDDLGVRVDIARASTEFASLTTTEQRRAWVEQWTSQNLNPTEEREYGAFVRKWLQVGSRKIATLNAIEELRGSEFNTIDDLMKALEAKGIPADERKAVVSWPLAKMNSGAHDVVLCFDLETGTKLWEAKFPAGPIVTNGASGTICVESGRVYVTGARKFYCLDATTGKAFWGISTNGTEVHSSFMAIDDLIAIWPGGPLVMNAQTGIPVWNGELPNQGYWSASPGLWIHNGKKYIIFPGNSLICYDPYTNKPLWDVPLRSTGLTPAIEGDMLVLESHGRLLGCQLSLNGINRLWDVANPDEYASPLIYHGYVYRIYGGLRRGCGTVECLDSKTGELMWQRFISPAEYSSPIIADNKIITFTDNGRYISLIAVDPKEYKLLARTRVLPQGWKGLWPCGPGWTSPALANGKLVVRIPTGMVCYDITQAANSEGIRPYGNLDNLALGMPARQSSDDDTASASRAVDGDSNGDPAHESIARTSQEEDPWWEVDLQKEQSISSIVVFPQIDPTANKQKHSVIRVIVSKYPFAKDSADYILKQTGNWISQPVTSIPKEGLKLNVSSKGRYVRILRVGQDKLSLAEVQVYPTK